MYLLDTNAVLHYLKGAGRVSENLLSKSPQEIGIPAVVLYELEVGVAKSDAPQKREQLLSTFLINVPVLPFAEKEAREAARVRTELEKAHP